MKLSMSMATRASLSGGRVSVELSSVVVSQTTWLSARAYFFCRFRGRR